MLNKRFIIFICILLLPLFVKAEDEYYSVTGITPFECREANAYYVYSDDIVYENGVYRLTGNLFNKPFNDLDSHGVDDKKIYYTCNRGETECESAQVVFDDTSCNTRGGKLGVILRDGLKKDDVESYYIGDDYTEENGQYTLVNPVKYNMLDVDSTKYLSNHYEGKYICPYHYGITCEDMVYITDDSNTHSYGAYVRNYYLIGNGYIKENGRYRLLNPNKVILGGFDSFSGYTCRSKESDCNDLYYADLINSHDTHDPIIGRYTLLEVSDKTTDVKIKLSESYNLLDYFSSEEMESLINTNPDVADVKNNKLELYKVGETLFVFEDAFNYKALHLTVTEDDIKKDKETKNPNTKDLIFIMFMVLVFSGIIGLLAKKKIII